MRLHYHPRSAYSRKGLIGMIESGRPFERAEVEWNERGWEKLRALWPMRKIPLLELDDGRVVAEASIILETVAPQLVPADRALALETRFLDRLADLYVNDLLSVVFTGRPRGADPKDDPPSVRDALEKMDGALGLLDARLAHGEPWAAGRAFTLADCAFAPALDMADVTRVVDLARFPRVRDYLARLRERPSVRAALNPA